MDRTDIGTLLIPNIKLSDSGTYMCVGSNSIGSNSAPIKVTVLKGQFTWRFTLVQYSGGCQWGASESLRKLKQGKNKTQKDNDTQCDA